MTVGASPRSTPTLDWHWDRFDRLSTCDLYAAMRLRQEVFVVEQRCIYLDVDGLDPKCVHGRAISGDRSLTAYARIVPPGLLFDEPSIGRVLVAPNWRGQGLGQLLVQQAIGAVRLAYPLRPIRISAQAQLESFYRRLGFVATGALYDDAGIAHRDMLLEPVE